LWVALFRNPAPEWERALFAGLAAVGPALWYLRWPHPEIFTWAFVLISLVLLRRREYPQAAASAAIAALQNPPVVFLALLAVGLSLRERRLRLTAAAAGAASCALLPCVFYLR